MTRDDMQPEEIDLARLLGAAQRDAAPPDRAFLDRLRDTSTEAFQAASSPPPHHQRKGRSMLFQTVRWLTVAAAAAILIGVTFHLWTSPQGPTLGEVLQKTQTVETAHFRVQRRTWLGADDSWDLLLKSGMWRAGGRDEYTLGRDHHVFSVEETANKVTAHPLRDHNQPRFLTMGALILNTALQQIWSKRPIERYVENGREFDVYQATVPHLNVHFKFHAVADAQTHLLQKLETTVEQRDGNIDSNVRVDLIAYNQPIPDEKFVVKDTLTEDGRVGKVVDVQGTVSVKPVMRDRWTPVCENLLLKPGDWVRTDVRGANAVALRLVKDTRIILGPGSLLEVIDPTLVRLIEGEAEFTVPKGNEVSLLTGDKHKTPLPGKHHFRIDKEQLVAVAKEPLWLKGFKGTTTNESLGSLIAKVDGRDMPLTVGYHKVTVDIRDQIARTVIEESFVNRTPTQLEGVFFFPLPQDASISGFGMWIGDTLVDADVVEKQRAREIYETILRERRDPGLLEWSGGNTFKARVFPIEPHSEKRIKISYTQVLPLRGNRYRYSYGLQSEMLKQFPLRELALDVKVNSVAPLKSVTCPTHTARIDKTEHSGHVEFTAQEHTPTRDFEVVFELTDRQNEVVMIPHRRGDDGYFMLQIMPTLNVAALDRDTLPDFDKLDLLILADTSASMDAGQRASQTAFLSSLFSIIGPKDTINLACCDVNCDWVFEKSMAADVKNQAAIREFLAKRVSLGWTDLDKAFASVLEKAKPNTQVIYIGDGIVTKGDGDPAAFAQRLRRMYGEKGATFHAVAVGNSFEPTTLKAIASLGGGSMRRITTEQGPQTIAFELLREISMPGLRNLKIEFPKIRTARVYPEELPNVPAGQQQIILGRYLPEGRDQVGEVIVTGTRGGKPVRFVSQIAFKDAEAGNSYIPRLWARMHLDQLLAQGSSQQIKDDIIALSEEFNIITPYTSLLVLESDADRERFKVKRRFQMRDGEKFFAEGRDNANYELTQKQMRKAGEWRVGLRRNVMNSMTGLGRNARYFQEQHGRYAGDFGVTRLNSELSEMGGMGFGGGGMGMPGGMPGGGGGFQGGWGMDKYYFANGNMPMATAASRSGAVPADRLELEAVEFAGAASEGGKGFRNDPDQLDELSAGVPALREKSRSSDWMERDEVRALILSKRADDSRQLRDLQTTVEELDGKDLEYAPMGGPAPAGFGLAFPGRPLGYGDFDMPDGYLQTLYDVDGEGRGSSELAGSGGGGLGGRYRHRGLGYYPQPPQYFHWLQTYYPALPLRPAKDVEPKTTWPADALALSRSLLRKDQLAKLTGGIRIDRKVETFDPRWNELSHRTQEHILYSPSGWTMRTEADRQQAVIHWCDVKERGAYSTAFQLGRVRTAKPEDLATLPFHLEDYSLFALHRSFAQYSVTMQPGKDQVVLMLKHVNAPTHVTRFTIDTVRHVITLIEHMDGERVNSSVKFSDFVEVAGSWWARKREAVDKEGRIGTATTLTVQAVAADALAGDTLQGLPNKALVQFLRIPLPTVLDAKKAVEAKKAAFEDQFMLLLHFARSQQWTKVMEHLQQLEKLAEAKPGVRWLRHTCLAMSRRNEELRQRWLEEAAKLTNAPADKSSELFLAEFLFQQGAGILDANELLALLDRVQPIHQRQPKHLHALKSWGQNRINYLRQVGRNPEALAISKQLATDYPRDYTVQQQYAYALVQNGDYQSAYAWLDKVITPAARWTPGEEETLRSTFAQFLEDQGRYKDLVAYLAAWVSRNPETSGAYSRYLSALVKNDEEEKANGLMTQWLKEAVSAKEITAVIAARTQAAVSQALGQGHNLHTNRIEERWVKPLAEVVLAFIRSESHHYLGDNVLHHWQFQQTDEALKVRVAIKNIVLTELDSLTVNQLQRLVQWVMWNGGGTANNDEWKRIRDGLLARWIAEKSDPLKHQIGQILYSVLQTHHGSVAELIAFLHREMREGPAAYRTHYTQQLFNTLLAQPYSVELEDEAFTLLTKLSDAEDAAQRLFASIEALHRLTDRMIDARYQEAFGQVKDFDKLTRTAQRQKHEFLRATARRAFAVRLQKELTKQPKELAGWVGIERQHLLTQMATQANLAWYELPFVTTDGANAKAVTAEAWEHLGATPKIQPAPKPDNVADVDPDAPPVFDLKHYLDTLLRNRHLAIVTYLTVRANDAALTDRLLKYIDAGIAADAEDPAWKMQKVRLVIALDKPKELETALRTWTKGEEVDNRWRLWLGYLLAEQGKIPDAITIFEQIENKDELGFTAYRTLADWYMVVNKRDQHDKSMFASYQTMPENYLNQLVHQKLNPWQRGGKYLPSELDPEVLRIFQVLFNKSAYPQNHLHILQQFYAACRDFRLLQMLPDAVVGQTAAKVYPFLQSMYVVTNEIRDEAVIDEMMAQLAKSRDKAQTLIDKRALDLLEALIHRRAAELKNQPGPHSAKALAALQRAFKGEWSSGEPRLMSDFLVSMGNIAQPDLAKEQLREVEALHAMLQHGTLDRLHIATGWAGLERGYGKKQEPIDRLYAALKEYLEPRNGQLAGEANNAVSALNAYLQADGHYAAGEKLLQGYLANPSNAGQRQWLNQLLFQLYHAALVHGGEVTLGTGDGLYAALHKRLYDEIVKGDENHRYQMFELLMGVYRTAHQQKRSSVKADVKAFATERLPKLLVRPTGMYDSYVGSTGVAVHDLVSVIDAIAFMLDRIDQEPKWLRLNNQDAWSRHANTIAHWRLETKSLGDLEPRLLKFVLAELRRDLESRQARYQAFYHRHHHGFWPEKEADFLKVAEEVLSQKKDSGASVQYIATYFYHGLSRYGRAIDILYAGLGRKVLDQSGEALLVHFLQEQNRWLESIVLLKPLIERQPGNLDFRNRLMRAYYRTQQPKELLAALDDADAYFHKDNRWNEGVMANLGFISQETELFDRAVSYLKEAIPLHERTQPNRGVGNGTLSHYYQRLASSYAGLKKTPEAVDAASAAIVAWGPNHQQRAESLHTLRDVLNKSPNLDAYVAHLDKQTTESGQDSPIIRLAVGQTFHDSRRFPQAIAQLKAAVELQPNDQTTHDLLISAYEQAGDIDGMIQALLNSVQLARRDIVRYERLGNLYQKHGKSQDAERAYTSIVEMLPNESESHAKLAEIRQNQNRWPEAVEQWERVAVIRALEPTGLVKLAEAQIHLQKWDDAKESIKKLRAKGWPAHFGDVPMQVRELEQRVEKK